MKEHDVPVFIKLEEYKDILNIVTVIKKKITESKNTLESLKQLKAEEDQELEQWENNLNDVKNKVEYVGGYLTQPKF